MLLSYVLVVTGKPRSLSTIDGNTAKSELTDNGQCYENCKQTF